MCHILRWCGVSLGVNPVHCPKSWVRTVINATSHWCDYPQAHFTALALNSHDSPACDKRVVVVVWIDTRGRWHWKHFVSHIATSLIGNSMIPCIDIRCKVGIRLAIIRPDYRLTIITYWIHHESVNRMAGYHRVWQRDLRRIILTVYMYHAWFRVSHY